MSLLEGRGDAYRKRVGLQDPVTADEAGMHRVHRAQLEAVAFENFDILMGRGVDVRPESVYQQLVDGGRGGYCFTCNTLLCEALTHFGIDARLALGRVLLGPPGPVPAKLHALVLADVGGRRWLVDAGFGAYTPREPIPLQDQATITSAGHTWRLEKDPQFGWRLRDAGRDGWRDLYVFDEARVYPSDVEVANHYVSTASDSPFTQHALVVRHTPQGRVTLLDRIASRYVDGHRDSRTLENAEALKRFVSEELHIALDADDAAWAALWTRLSGPELPMQW